MSELLHTLGIDWKLLLAQAANFLIVVVVLRLTIYKPLIKMLHERRSKIEQGLKDASSAKEKLENIEVLEQERLAEAEKKGLAMLSEAEKSMKEKEMESVKAMKKKEAEIIENAERVARAKKSEQEEKLYEEAIGIVKAALAKTVQANPKMIDEALVKEAMLEVKKGATS